ncbi:MAG: hypothetical protein V4482_06805 [Pseudomonadota bacterium]
MKKKLLLTLLCGIACSGSGFSMNTGSGLTLNTTSHIGVNSGSNAASQGAGGSLTPGSSTPASSTWKYTLSPEVQRAREGTDHTITKTTGILGWREFISDPSVHGEDADKHINHHIILSADHIVETLQNKITEQEAKIISLTKALREKKTAIKNGTKKYAKLNAINESTLAKLLED